MSVSGIATATSSLVDGGAAAEGAVKAKLRGSAAYQVQLGLDKATYQCTCPVGQDDRFCKHAVAVSLIAAETVTDVEPDDAVDDPDGWMPGIAERLQDLHLTACEAAQPVPVALAGTLFDRERHDGDLEVF